jgi:adenylate kinase
MSVKNLVLIMLGAPGAGKGTACKPMMDKYSIPQISTGDMFRAAIKEGTPMGKEAKSYMDKGALVPDEVVIGLVRERIQKEDCENGFILDGFPRTVDQAEALNELLSSVNKELTAVLNLKVDREILIKRLTGRRMCRGCTKGNFNIYTLKPRNEGRCDYCDSELYQRDDDKEEVILNRLDVYERQTQPLINYYENISKIENIESADSLEETVKRVFIAIEKRIGIS